MEEVNIEEVNVESLKKAKVGRPKIPDSEKAVYQRVPIAYETYKKLLAFKEEHGGTYTELIEAMLTEHKLNI